MFGSTEGRGIILTEGWREEGKEVWSDHNYFYVWFKREKGIGEILIAYMFDSRGGILKQSYLFTLIILQKLHKIIYLFKSN
jgi:hypothetical protein